MHTLALFASLVGSGSQQPIDLLPGKDLAGWIRRGGVATYGVEGNELVGTCVLNTPNTFLCTERTFGDFVLEYEFKVDPRLNSGVQVRSECFDLPKKTLWQGKEIDIPSGRVHGYQIEIDPDPAQDRWWTAGIYDEGRRGWLYPGPLGGDGKTFTGQGRALFKRGDWNHVRVEAKGESIKTWLNGKPCAEVRDAMTLRGFIGLQVHGIGNDEQKKGAQVRWRNMKLADLTPPPNTLARHEEAAGWRLLWDGKTTKGWRGAKSDAFPAKGWQIENGELTVLASGGGESVAGGDIVTTERFGQFELMLEFRIAPGANSGIKYYCQPNLDPITGTGAKAATGSAIGLEYQILDDERHPDAKQGRDGNRTVASLYDLIPALSTKQPSPIGEWNCARIACVGSQVTHWLNGQKVLEYERGSSAFRGLIAQSKYRTIPSFGDWADGHILLQDHGDRVSFRSIKIRTATSAGEGEFGARGQARAFPPGLCADANPLPGSRPLPGSLRSPTLSSGAGEGVQKP
ncbi:MAG TPA: DUF1080 domain-containing protein [Fimbriimonadaceae bacterium]|nr:DUF1080 domain-containing protein [Fimbriimonadaceae bacterium]HRJ97085.1 DUF1080 domain-containing protein [Fimbriimonadaceae bacterium]